MKSFEVDKFFITLNFKGHFKIIIEYPHISTMMWYHLDRVETKSFTSWERER